VFSAFGAAASDIHHSLQRSSRGAFPEDLPGIAAAYASMEDEARGLLRRQDVAEERIRLSRWMDLRYARQLHDVRVNVPPGELGESFVDAVRRAFRERYAALYGASALLENMALQALRVGVEAVGQIQKPAWPVLELGEPDPSAAADVPRRVYWPEAGAWLETGVYDGPRLRPGNRIAGPAVIELPGTTIAVPPGDRAEIDRFGSTVITLGEKRTDR
jgi:N-methylhydantoinase A